MSNEKQNLTKLKDVIFTDGKILSLDTTRDVLKVRFCDYANTELELIFYDVSTIQTTDDMYFEVADYEFISKTEVKVLTLLDDENRPTFLVKFKESSVNFL